MNLNFSLVVLIIFFWSCTEKSKPKDMDSKTNTISDVQMNNKKKRSSEVKKEIANLFSINMKNRSDLLKNKNWQKFDSIWYKWESDTLLLNHIRFVKNACGDYQLKSTLIQDTILLSFVDPNQCDLTSILETKSKVIIEKPENFIVKFNNKILSH